MGFRKLFTKRVIIWSSSVAIIFLVTAQFLSHYFSQELDSNKADKVAESAFIAHDKNKFYYVTPAGASPVSEGFTGDFPIVRIAGIISNELLKKQTFQLLKDLKSNERFSTEKVSEIHHDKVEGFTVWMNDGQTSVKLGIENLETKTSLVDRVMEYLDQERVRARVIDARFKKKVVVRPRNDT
jgi:hypothetical protein